MELCVGLLGSIALMAAAGVAWADDHHAADGAERSDPVVGETLVEDRQEFIDALATGYRASRLLGAGVFNDDGEQIGSIRDIIVGSDLQVSLAVLSVGGFLGVGTHLIAVPADRFEQGSGGELVLPGATTETVRKIPEFRFVE